MVLQILIKISNKTASQNVFKTYQRIKWGKFTLIEAYNVHMYSN